MRRSSGWLNGSLKGVILHWLKRFGYVAVLCSLAPATSAFALKHVTLRSGFSYDCSRLETVDSGRVRLYLNAPDGSSGNYVELRQDEIASVEAMPDPPPATHTQSAAAAPAKDMRQMLAHAGERHDIDVDLLASVVKAESGGNARAVSRTGAQGLMQLMPGTAQQLGVTDSFVPEQNINGGTAYLDALLTRYHDNLALALAAYNAGPAAVDRYHGIPPFRETRAYVARVMREFKRRKEQSQRALLASR